MKTTPLETLHRDIIKSINAGTLKEDYPGFVKRVKKINVSTYTLNLLISTVQNNLNNNNISPAPEEIPYIYNEMREKTHGSQD